MKGVRSADKVISGEEFSEREAKLIATFALVAFANAKGLLDPHASTLARFAPDMGMTDPA